MQQQPKILVIGEQIWVSYVWNHKKNRWSVEQDMSLQFMQVILNFAQYHWIPTVLIMCTFQIHFSQVLNKFMDILCSKCWHFGIANTKCHIWCANSLMLAKISVTWWSVLAPCVSLLTTMLRRWLTTIGLMYYVHFASTIIPKYTTRIRILLKNLNSEAFSQQT